VIKDCAARVINEIDHNAAHLQWGNQFLHLVSSIMMLGVYWLIVDWFLGNRDLKLAALVTIAAQTMRQGGHFFIEGNATEKEKLKIGYTTRMKQIAVYGIIPTVFATWYFNPIFRTAIDGYSLALAVYGVLISYRILWLSFYGDHILQGWVWWWKIWSDMFTDIQLMKEAGLNAELSIGYNVMSRDVKNKSVINEYKLM
jgi:hypothetical protein